jgi:hypothetical protein
MRRALFDLAMPMLSRTPPMLLRPINHGRAKGRQRRTRGRRSCQMQRVPVVLPDALDTISMPLFHPRSITTVPLAHASYFKSSKPPAFDRMWRCRPHISYRALPLTHS